MNRILTPGLILLFLSSFLLDGSIYPELPDNAKKTEDFEKTFLYKSGMKGSDEARSGEELSNGDMAMIGLGMNKTRQQAFFALFKTNPLFQKDTNKAFPQIYRYYGGNANTEAFVLKSISDKRFLMVGSQEDEKQEIKGWLQIIDEKGEVIWTWSDKTRGTSILYAVEALGTDQFLAVGKKRNKIWLVLYNQETSQITEKTISSPTYCVANSIAIHHDEIAIGGYKYSKFNVDGLSVEQPKHGVFLSFKMDDGFPDKIKVEPINAIEKSKVLVYHEYFGTYFMLGDTTLSNDNKDVQVVEITRDTSGQRKGKRKKEWNYTPLRLNEINGDYQEEANTMTITREGDFLIGGKTRSFPGGYQNFFYPYLAQFRKNGRELVFAKSLKKAIGTKYNEEINALFFSRSGGLFILGKTYRGKASDAFAMRIVETTPTDALPPHIEVTALHFMDDSKNDTLLFDEQGSIRFQVENKEETTARGLVASIDFATEINGLAAKQTLRLHPLHGGQNRTYEIPLAGDFNLFSGQTDARIIIKTLDGQVLSASKDVAKVITEAAPLPRLKILNSFEQVPEDLPDRGDTIRVTVQVQNVGEARADSSYVHFSYPYFIHQVSSRKGNLGALEPGEIKSFRFSFIADAFYPYDYVPLKCVAFDNTTYLMNFAYFKSSIESYFNINAMPGGGDSYELPRFLQDPWIKYYRSFGPGERAVERLRLEDDEVWLYKKEELKKLKKGKNVRTECILIRAAILTDQPFKNKQVEVWINGKKARGNVLKQTLDEEVKNKRQVFFAEIRLEEGPNRIEIKTRGKSASSVIQLNYTPPDLYVLVIGIPYADLKFTLNDAKSVAEIIKAQAGQGVYNNVEVIHVDTLESNTSQEALRASITDLTKIHDPDNNRKIMVYVSGHGATQKINDETYNYFLIPSRYKTEKERNQIEESEYDNQFVNVKPLIEALGNEGTTSFGFFDVCYSEHAVEMSEAYIADKGIITEVPFSLAQATKIESSYRPSMYIFSATTKRGVALENATKCGGHGCFTYIFLDVITNNTQENRRITIAKFYKDIRNKLRAIISYQDPRMHKGVIDSMINIF